MVSIIQIQTGKMRLEQSVNIYNVLFFNAESESGLQAHLVVISKLRQGQTEKNLK